MKKLFTFFLALVASVGSMSAAVVNGTCGDNLTWTVNSKDSTLVIEGSGAMTDYSNGTKSPWYEYKAYIAYVSLPDGLTNIGSYAFDAHSSLKSIVMPNSVTKIGSYALDLCKKLSSITFSENITTIGERAFRQNICTSIVLPESLTSMGNGNFDGCKNITAIKIPDNLTTIEYQTFQNCTSLTNVTIGKSVTNIGSSAFYNTAVNTVICFAPNPPSGGANCNINEKKCILYVPYSSIEIYKNSIWWEDFASILPIPGTEPCVTASGTCGDNLTWELSCDSVLTISGSGAMTSAPWINSNKAAIKSVIIEDGITNIYRAAFWYCSNLKNVTIGNSVTNIENYAFNECTGLKKLTIGNNIINIGQEAFSGCSNLTFIELPNSVISIGNWAFNRCSSLTSVTIPNNVSSIGGGLFGACNSLTEINVVDNNNYSSIDGVLFNKDQTTLVQYPGGKQGSYIIPNNVINIGNAAFFSLKCLTSVTIPNTVSSIGDWAFDGCSGLVTITCEALTPPICGADEFYNVDKSIPLYVPAESIDLYKAADQWKDFTNILPIPGTEVPTCPFTGTCGDNLTWELSCDSVLTISGSGDIPGYSSSSQAPWYDNRDRVKNIIVGDNVTSIGQSAFGMCNNLDSISIGKSVTFIDNYVLYQLNNLRVITCYAENPPEVYGKSLSLNSAVILYVPGPSINAYRNAYRWKTYNTVLPIPGTEEPYYPITIHLYDSIRGAEVDWAITEEVNPDTSFFGEYNYTSHYYEYLVDAHGADNKWNFVAHSTPRYKVNGWLAPDFVASDSLLLTVHDTTDITLIVSSRRYPIHLKTNNYEQGLIGTSTYQTHFDTTFYSLYADSARIEAFPKKGYRFDHWSDGNTENPRYLFITQDVDITAYFEADSPSCPFSGTCGLQGDNLTWLLSCDSVLTISGNGAMLRNSWEIPWDEHQNEVRSVFVEDGVTTIGATAFRYCYNLSNVVIGKDVTTIYEDAFFNDSALSSITCKAINPPVLSTLKSGVFYGVDKSIPLYVPGSSIAAYKAADQWKDFTNIQPIEGTFPVTFLDYNGEVLSEQNVAYNQAATAPEVPAREGYTFSGWSTDIEHIVARTFAIALYDKIGGTLTYLSEEGDVIATENVDLHLPAAPIIAGKSFKGWLTESADSENGIVLRATYTFDNPTTHDDVTITPSSNSAYVIFPFITGALTYQLVIRDLFGNVVCKIMFSATGHLLGIAFAPSRNRESQQATQTTGFNFTVEGLDANTTYEYEFVANDDTDEVIETLSGSFTTTAEVPTDNEQVNSPSAVRKYLEDGHLMIDANSHIFNTQGKMIK